MAACRRTLNKASSRPAVWETEAPHHGHCSPFDRNASIARRRASADGTCAAGVKPPLKRGQRSTLSVPGGRPYAIELLRRSATSSFPITNLNTLAVAQNIAWSCR